MGLRSIGLLLLMPLAYGCGAEDDLVASDTPELPYGMSAPEADAGSPARQDGGSKPGTSRDAGTVWLSDDPLNADSACAASALAAEQVVVEEQVQVEVQVSAPAPVALYVMLDRSSSMAVSLWTPAVKALTTFIRESGSSGMDMALQYFPNGGSCNGSGYSTPAVAPGRLPAYADTLVGSLGKQSPSGIGTPIEGALRGATEYCKSFQTQNPKERCVAVLVTDGKPEFDLCEKNDDKLSAIAAAAWTQFQVRTFAVGLSGADFGLLDMIAKAGGAADCDPNSARFSCDVSGGADKLGVALGKIRDTVSTVETHTELQTQTKTRPLECEWHMPVPSADMTVDTDQVNVTLSGGNTEPLNLGRVPSLSACQPGAWYFDAPSAPERVIACPATCDTIKSGGYTDVSILLGCQTHVLLL